jgi:hypothetical protein
MRFPVAESDDRGKRVRPGGASPGTIFGPALGRPRRTREITRFPMAPGTVARPDFQGTENSLHCSRTLATTALAAFTALITVALSHAGEVAVQWTAPGGDGYLGRATAYDLRYSRQVITDADFALATAVTSVPAPGAPGTVETCTITGLEAGVTYYFAIKTVDAAGNWSAISNVLSGEIREVSGQPIALQLAFSPPRPNPAREQTSFRLALPSAAPVRVEIFDVTGRRVRLLAQTDFAAGLMDLGFDLRDDAGVRLARGIYLVRACLGATVFTQRLVVVK